jgi:hypothetical protein
MTPTTSPVLAAMAAARAEFAQLRSRVRAGIWIETLGVVGLLGVAFAAPSFVCDRLLRLEVAVRVALALSFVAVVAWQIRRRLVGQLAVALDDDEIALAVERRAPEMHEALISSLQFDRAMATPSIAGNESRALMAAVVADTNARLRSIPFAAAIDHRRVRRFLAALLAAIACFAGWGFVDAGSLSTWARRNLLFADVDWPRHTALVFADGAAAIRLPQGDALTVRVAAQGLVPEQVVLDYAFASGESGSEPMSSTGDGEFVLTLETVLEDVVLQANGGDALPAELRVTVVERPRVEVALTIVYPPYMAREPEQVPATEGDVRLPVGAALQVAGRSHKPVVDSFALFGDDRKVALQRGADGHSFSGELVPEQSGLLVVDVLDGDRLGAAAPPRYLVRVGPDQPPTLDLRLFGIGSLVAAHARIPGDLKVRDDFGLRAIDVSMRATEAEVSERGPDEASAVPEIPFAAAAAAYDEPFALGSLRYASRVAVDLRQWNPQPDENDKDNRIRPGMLLALRYGATDNFGPGDPHQGYSEVVTFRVVTRERLNEDLRRRQIEQRNELEKIVAEHHAAALEFGELAEIVLTGARPDDERRVANRLVTLARQQVSLGRRTAFIAESYQRLLAEFENNRLWDGAAVRQREAVISRPLEALAKDAFPASGRRVETFAGTRQEAASKDALKGYADIAQRLLAVLAAMEQAETVAAILEDLRAVIKIEDTIHRQVDDAARQSAEDILGPGKGQPRKDDDNSK